MAAFLFIALWMLVLSYIEAEIVHPLQLETTYLPESCKSYKARRAVRGDRLKVAFQVFVDESSPVGIPGSLFDTSAGRAHSAYVFQLGATGYMHGWEEA